VASGRHPLTRATDREKVRAGAEQRGLLLDCSGNPQQELVIGGLFVGWRRRGKPASGAFYPVDGVELEAGDCHLVLRARRDDGRTTS
jgi:hypothetical protein